jgi:hypothetical protein
MTPEEFARRYSASIDGGLLPWQRKVAEQMMSGKRLVLVTPRRDRDYAEAIARAYARLSASEKTILVRKIVGPTR